MTATTNVKQVKLNIMTQQQFATATKSPTELYMITDANSSVDIDETSITYNASDKIQAAGVIDKNSGSTSYDWIGTRQEYDNLNSYNNSWTYYITDDDITISGIDESTITYNSSNKIQTVGVKNTNGANTLKLWTGTKQQYDAIELKDSNTIYNVTDENNNTTLNDLLSAIYPVGSLYFGLMAVCPLDGVIGTWERIGNGRVIQGADSNYNAGETIPPGLPNITGGALETAAWQSLGAIANFTGAFEATDTGGGYPQSGGYSTSYSNGYTFDASRCSSIYGNSDTVQPPALAVNIWRRVS